MKALRVILILGAASAAAVLAYRYLSPNLLGGSTEAGYASKATTVLQSGEVRLTGVVVAREVVVSSKVSGRIEELKVDEGSLVNLNDLIARMDQKEAVAQREINEAMVSQFNAKLKQSQEAMQLEAERGENQISRARAQFEVSESELKRAQAELVQAKAEANRAKRLSEEGILAKSELERSETAVHVSEALTRSLEDKVRAARAELEIYKSSQRQVSVAAADVEQTNAQIDQARAQLVQSRVRLSEAEVRAPMAGLVSVRVASAGEIVNAGTPIVTIVDLDDIWAKADVEESLVSRVAIGGVVAVHLASGEEISGKVINVSPEAEFATQRDVNRVKRDIRTFAIRVKLPNLERRIHPGMTAYVVLPVGPNRVSRASQGSGALATDVR